MIKTLVSYVTQSATPAVNTDNVDVVSITGLAQAITSMTTNLTGTPVVGDRLTIEVTDDGTARAIAWGASFEAGTYTALPTTTVISTKLTVDFRWNPATSKWRGGVTTLAKGDVGLGNVTNNAQYYAGGTDVAITDGGTGVSTLPSGLLKGAGTGAITAGAAGTDYVAPGGALGTPSSGTATNLTGLPVSGITASTSTALGVGSIELGHASDTTLSRSAAGVLAVEGVAVATRDVATTASSATPTVAITASNMQYTVTALAANATFGAPTGSPGDGWRLLIRIKDNATARTLAFNSIFRAIGVTLPTTTVISKTTYLGCVWNQSDTKWDVVAVGQEA